MDVRALDFPSHEKALRAVTPGVRIVELIPMMTRVRLNFWNMNVREYSTINTAGRGDSVYICRLYKQSQEISVSAALPLDSLCCWDSLCNVIADFFWIVGITAELIYEL